MSVFTCKNIRLAVAFAGSLFVLGLMLQVPRVWFDANFPVFTTLLSGTGLLAMLLSPLMMMTLGALALIPGVARRLDHCTH